MDNELDNNYRSIICAPAFNPNGLEHIQKMLLISTP